MALIWETGEYQSSIRELLKKKARNWVKNKIDESKGIIRCETVFE